MLIAIYGSRRQSEPKLLADLLQKLVTQGAKLAVETRFAQTLQDLRITLPPDAVTAVQTPLQAGTPQMLISLGGDGTFLRAAAWVKNTQIPILGINTGHLGFLSTYRLENTDRLLHNLLHGQMRAEPRMLLQLHADTLPDDFHPYALNEIALLKEETSAMLDISTTVDQCFIGNYLSDGLVISTPTGSTAYNLSIGGPILQPTLNCCVISPIAPHSLTFRPLVVSGESQIQCHVKSRADRYRVSLDGRSLLMPEGSSIRISRAPYTIHILRRPGDDFAYALRHKLLWSTR